MTLPNLDGDKCRDFLLDKICPVIGWIVVGGMLVAWYVFNEGMETEEIARANQLTLQNAVSSLDAHIVQERDSTNEIKDILGRIESDQAVMKYRLNNGTYTGGMASPE